MLSRKYLTIKKVLTGVSKIGFLHRKLIVLSKMYLDINKGFRFSYLPDENGESDFLAALKEIYKKQDFVFFDVGAHTGTYTDEIIQRFSSYKGHLFDLSKETFDVCKERHGNNTHLTINNLGLTDKIEQVEYRYYSGHLDQQTGIAGVGPYLGYKFELRTAECITGDHYCQTNGINHINLLKIDVEGYDLHVLKGFEEMLSKSRIDVIQFEYNIKASETHSMLGDFYEYLEKRGYAIGPLRRGGVIFRKFDYTQNDFENGPNYIACLPKFQESLSKFLPQRLQDAA